MSDDFETALDDRARARVGLVLRDKWRLDSLLGIGGMACVYAATHRNGKRVAVKVLHPELSVIPDIRTRFLREGYVANKVEHPGAVSVLDDDVTDDGAVFLVMDLLEGETLEASWERADRRFSIPETIRVASLLLDVLAAAHDKGIVHRDIKPENVFLCRDGGLKVLDFGIARLRELSNSSGGSTKDGTTMGTPAFMPPEQARGHWDRVDQRSDLWSVGATMFTLLAGRWVHRANTINEQLLAAMTARAEPIEAICPGVPPSLAQVVNRALAFELEDRWPDARSMQAALHPGAYQATLASEAVAPSAVSAAAPIAPATTAPQVPTTPTAGPSTIETPSATAATRKRNVVVMGAGAAILLLALGGFAAFAFRARSVASAIEPVATAESTTRAVASPSAVSSAPEAPAAEVVVVDEDAGAGPDAQRPASPGSSPTGAKVPVKSGPPAATATASATKPPTKPPATKSAPPGVDPLDRRK